MRWFSGLLASLSLILACRALAQDIPTAQTQPGINLRETVTVDVFRRTRNAVVNISTTKLVNQRISRFGHDPFWQQFDFGEVMKVPTNSLGSGFIIHPEGYIVTNHHVIDRAREINVELADGRKTQAELISSDSDSDLAILRIPPAEDGKALPYLELGDSSDLMIGEPVIAVGNPLGFSHSVSTGIVSAVHRDLRDQNNQVMLGDLVQTDAAINPGNSGGPLLNAYGQVIAINTAIRGDAQNIGFAIQVNRLRDLIPDLMNPAQVTKVDVPLRLREKRAIKPPATVTAEVMSQGNDQQIESINGQPIKSIIEAYALLLKVRAADKEVVIHRSNGKDEHIVVKEVPQPNVIAEARNKLGITVEQMTPLLAQRYGMGAEEGMFVSEVLRDSVASRAGIQTGDVIVQLGRYRVSTLEDFSALLQHLPQSGRVRIRIIRGDQVGVGMLEL